MKKIFFVKRAVSVLLAISMTFALCVCSHAEQQTKAEIIEDFKNSLVMGDWVPATGTEEQVKTMAENGVQYTFIWYYDYNNEFSRKQVEWCGKYGIKCILMDVHFSVNQGTSLKELLEYTPEQIAEIIEPNINNPTVIGYNIYDEPYYGSFEDIGKFIKNFEQVAGNLITFVNLYPSVVGSAGASSYQEYSDGVFEKIGLDFVAVDIYPLLDGSTWIPYLENIRMVADAARTHDGDFWMFIQSMALISEGKRAPNMGELRFQAYSALSFGAKKLMHFCYKNPWSENEGFASIASDGETKTSLWPLTQTLNKEMQYLSDIYVQYKNQGAYAVYTKSQQQTPQYLRERVLTIQQKCFRTIKAIESEQPLLIGTFNHSSDLNKKAFTLVNMSELIDNTPTNILLDLRYANKVTLTGKAVSTVLTPNAEGKYAISLESGEGVFVEVEETKTAEQAKVEDLFDEYNTSSYWLDNQESAIYEPETYDVLMSAMKAIEAVKNSDISYSETRPLIETMRQALANLQTKQKGLRLVAEKLLSECSALSAKYFTPDTFNKLNDYVDKLQKLYDQNYEETINTNAELDKAINFVIRFKKALVLTGETGDLNDDGVVSIIDAMMSFRYVAGKEVLDNNHKIIGDMNKSQDVNIEDSMILFRKVAGKE